MNFKFLRKIILILGPLFWVLNPFILARAETSNINYNLEVQEHPVAEELSPKYLVVSVGNHYITAYNSEASQCDESPCITANGFNLCQHNTEDVIAANFLSFGDKIRIPELFGDRVFIVVDRMNSRYSSYVDIWMKEKNDALNFGIKMAKIEVLEQIIE